MIPNLLMNHAHLFRKETSLVLYRSTRVPHEWSCNGGTVPKISAHFSHHSTWPLFLLLFLLLLDLFFLSSLSYLPPVSWHIVYSIHRNDFPVMFSNNFQRNCHHLLYLIAPITHSIPASLPMSWCRCEWFCMVLFLMTILFVVASVLAEISFENFRNIGRNLFRLSAIVKKRFSTV